MDGPQPARRLGVFRALDYRFALEAPEPAASVMAAALAPLAEVDTDADAADGFDGDVR